MTRFLEIKEIFRLDKSIKKKDPPQNKTKTKKTQNLSSLTLFTFVVLLSIDVGVAVINICLFCSKK
jgi:hypothetical protein